MMAYAIHIFVVLLYAYPFVNLNVIESWFKVNEKEPVAYAKVEVIEASEMKPSDLNGYPLPVILLSFFFLQFLFVRDKL